MAALQVRWEMTGSSPFMFKVMSLFTSMDKMIGKDFEAGLANMKAAAEQKPFLNNVVVPFLFLRDGIELR